MKIKWALSVSVMFAALVFLACGGSGKKEVTTQSILNSTEGFGIKKSADVETYVGQSLFEYIDGGAEIFHQYGFLEVSTVAFDVDDIELTAAVYEFDNSDDAYGMYSMLRPDDANIVNIGVEGFKSEASLDFVKGSFLVRLICYDVTEGTSRAIDRLVDAISKEVPGTTEMPGTFSLFPVQNEIPHSERIIAESYLGQAFLTDVYEVRYDWEPKGGMAFIIPDSAEAKFTQWAKTAEIDVKFMKSLKDLPFDSGKMLITENHYYGEVVTGLKNGKLIGIVGYQDNQKTFLDDWLKSLSG